MPAVMIGTTIAVLVVATMIWALLDLSRHEVAYLPKWAWAMVIVLLSIIGVGIYLLAGRVPADGGRSLVARWQQEQDASAEFMLYGMVIGMVIGTALGQIGLGLALGLVVGALVDVYRDRRPHR